jgi:hypothetical protein
MQGYYRNNVTQYMNVGYVSSPYPGKEGWGDYGPLQGGEIYYRPANATYPYPMWGSDYPGQNPYPGNFPLYIRQQQGKAPMPR